MNAYSQQSTRNGAMLPQGFWKSAGGAYTFKPTDGQFTSNRLNDLVAGNSKYIQAARTNAAASSAARGLGNGSYAAGNAELAAIQAAMPIAQADAQTDSNAALANQQALNRILEANNQNATSVNVANIGAGASMYGADKNFESNKYGIDQQMARMNAQNEYDAGQRDIDRQYNQSMLGLQDYYRRQQFGDQLWGDILKGSYATMYSNPDYFNNPEASLGFINGFGNFAGNQIGQYLYGGNP